MAFSEYLNFTALKLKNWLVKTQVKQESCYFRRVLISFCQVEIGLSEVNCLEWLRRLEREIWNSACHIFTTASFFRPWKTYHCILPHSAIYSSQLDTVQDFLIKLGIKLCMHLWEMSIFSLINVIFRPTKIMNRADKN